MAQQETVVIRHADSLIALRQYHTAFLYLDSIDPSNNQVDIFLEKEKIFLNYFAQSIMHCAFALADLGEGESLDSLRANFSTGNMYAFDADSLSMRLLASDKDNCKLLHGHTAYHKTFMEDYGYDMWYTFLDSACVDLLTQASEGKCNDADASFMMAIYHSDNSVPTSVEYLKRALRQCDTMWDAYSNLGYFEYLTDDNTSALEHLNIAYEGYNSPSLKSDVARFMSIIYEEQLGDVDNALKYASLAIEADSAVVDNYVVMLSLLLRHNMYGMEETLAGAWDRALLDDDVFNACSYLISLCAENNHKDISVAFLKQRLSRSNDNYELGLINYLLSQLSEDRSHANKYIKSAINYFKQDGAPDSFIDDLLQMIEEE